MLKHNYSFSNKEICEMSLYNIQNYINNIPMVLGQVKEELPTNKIDDDKELVKRAKELGLKVPKYY